jgi:hypothetical protein
LKVLIHFSINFRYMIKEFEITSDGKPAKEAG